MLSSMSRRDFLKGLYHALLAVGGSTFISFEELEAMEVSLNKPDVIWIHGMSCDGCSTSFLYSDVTILDILSKFANVIFHPTLMAATGDKAIEILDEYQSNNLLTILEGGIPLDMPHACMMADRYITDWIEELAKKSVAMVAAGTCATFNGVCDMDNMVTGACSLRYFLEKRGVATPVVNLPTCPMKPDHLLYVLFYYIKHKKLPALDEFRRPMRFFGETIHERCIFYNDFQEKIFAKEIGDRGCLIKLGCQGPVTKNDCVKSNNKFDQYNCIKSGHPCVGCASESFPRKIMFKSYDDNRKIKPYKTFKRI